MTIMLIGPFIFFLQNSQAMSVVSESEGWGRQLTVTPNL